MADLINLAERAKKLETVKPVTLTPDSYKVEKEPVEFIQALAMTCPECGGQKFMVMLDVAGAKDFSDLLGHIVQFECANPDCGVIFEPDEENEDKEEE